MCNPLEMEKLVLVKFAINIESLGQISKYLHLMGEEKRGKKRKTMVSLMSVVCRVLIMCSSESA
jgi:hypothetical protein